MTSALEASLFLECDTSHILIVARFTCTLALVWRSLRNSAKSSSEKDAPFKQRACHFKLASHSQHTTQVPAARCHLVHVRQQFQKVFARTNLACICRFRLPEASFVATARALLLCVYQSALQELAVSRCLKKHRPADTRKKRPNHDRVRLMDQPASLSNEGRHKPPKRSLDAEHLETFSRSTLSTCEYECEPRSLVRLASFCLRQRLTVLAPSKPCLKALIPIREHWAVDNRLGGLLLFVLVVIISPVRHQRQELGTPKAGEGTHS